MHHMPLAMGKRDVGSDAPTKEFIFNTTSCLTGGIFIIRDIRKSSICSRVFFSCRREIEWKDI